MKCLLLAVIWPFFLCGFNFSCSRQHRLNDPASGLDVHQDQRLDHSVYRQHCKQISQICIWSARNNATSDNWVLPIIWCPPVAIVSVLVHWLVYVLASFAGVVGKYRKNLIINRFKVAPAHRLYCRHKSHNVGPMTENWEKSMSFWFALIIIMDTRHADSLGLIHILKIHKLTGKIHRYAYIMKQISFLKRLLLVRFLKVKPEVLTTSSFFVHIDDRSREIFWTRELSFSPILSYFTGETAPKWL